MNLAIFLHSDLLRKKGLNASIFNIFVPYTFLLVNGQFDIWWTAGFETYVRECTDSFIYLMKLSV